MTIPSITDDLLAEIEQDCKEADTRTPEYTQWLVASLIARVRELEKDAARWRKARDILTVETIETAQSEFINFGLPPAESESLRADTAIDAAMQDAACQ